MVLATSVSCARLSSAAWPEMLAATPSNYIRPYKRPLSSIAPTIVSDSNGRFVFATGRPPVYLPKAPGSNSPTAGAAGGSRITTATIQMLWHVLDQGLDAQSAINLPRMHDQIIPTTTTFEYAYDNSTTAYLASLGSNVTWVAPGLSVVQAITRDKKGIFFPASDPRKLDSCVASCLEL